MSQTAVEQVVGKMLLDAEFRKLMASNMLQALAGFDLTEEEHDSFKNMDLQDFDRTVTGLDERVSKGRSLQ
jgi:hypothetical protein